MTQTERLVARILKACKENPSSCVGFQIVTDCNGEPFLWFPEQCVKVDGNDEVLITSGIKPAIRKVTA